MRPRTIGVTALAAAVALTVAFVPTSASASTTATATRRCSIANSTDLPSLSEQKLRESIANLPNDEVTGALVQIRGSAGCWEGTSGVAQLGRPESVPIDGRFRIGSMTKTFTAVVALQLVGEHRLDLTRTVQSYLPQLLPASYPPITVRQVLNYTSGLNHINVPHKQTDWFLAHRYDVWAPGSQIDTTLPLAFTPGTQQRYGNVDYIVAGLLIEKVTGHSWASEVTRRIINRLDLRGTTVPGDDVDIHGPHAHGYEAIDDEWVDVTRANTSLQWSAAAVISTAPDLDRFLVAIFTGRLLPAAQLEEMFTVPTVPTFDTGQPATYSIGLNRIPVGSIIVWGKSGDRPGYNNGMGATRDLSRRLVFSVNTIHMGGEQPVISQRIIAAVLT